MMTMTSLPQMQTDAQDPPKSQSLLQLLLLGLIHWYSNHPLPGTNVFVQSKKDLRRIKDFLVAYASVLQPLSQVLQPLPGTPMPLS